MEFGDLKTEEGLEKLSTHLKSNTYVTGHQVSKEDFATQFKMEGKFYKFPSIIRWHRNLMSFAWSELIELGVEFPCCGDKATCDKATCDKGTCDKGTCDKGTCDKGTCDKGTCDKPCAKKADDIDLFGDDDEEDPEAEKARLASIAEKKAAKEAAKVAVTEKKVKAPVIAKSSLVIKVMPAGIEIDLEKLAQDIRKIKMDGVEWSLGHSTEAVAFGLMSLQLGCTIIDELVQTDNILEAIEILGMSDADASERKRLRDEGEDFEGEDGSYSVASANIISFNKL